MTGPALTSVTTGGGGGTSARAAAACQRCAVRSTKAPALTSVTTGGGGASARAAAACQSCAACNSRPRLGGSAAHFPPTTSAGPPPAFTLQQRGARSAGALRGACHASAQAGRARRPVGLAGLVFLMCKGQSNCKRQLSWPTQSADSTRSLCSTRCLCSDRYRLDWRCRNQGCGKCRLQAPGYAGDIATGIATGIAADIATGIATGIAADIATGIATCIGLPYRHRATLATLPVSGTAAACAPLWQQRDLIRNTQRCVPDCGSMHTSLTPNGFDQNYRSVGP